MHASRSSIIIDDDERKVEKSSFQNDVLVVLIAVRMNAITVARNTNFETIRETGASVVA